MAGDLAVELRIPSDPRLLHLVRSVVGEASSLRGFSEEDTQFIILAVDEACSNIIKHAYKDRRDGPISISCREQSDGIEFRLADSGMHADMSQWRGRPLEEVRPGGLGLHLIRAVMDKVVYRRGEQGNELVLVKSLRSDGNSGKSSSSG